MSSDKKEEIKLDKDKLALPTTDRKQQIRISIRTNGVGLAGMAAWGDNANSGISASVGLKKALGSAATQNGCVKMFIEGDILVGNKIRVKPGQPWGEHLDSLQVFVEKDNPVYFALFRSEKQCLLISYVPDNASPKMKMKYASTKNSVKEAVLEADPHCHLEEFNISTVEELSYAEYHRRETAPKFYTEQELLAKEMENADTGGTYNILARLGVVGKDKNDPKPIALPGLANLKKNMPPALQARMTKAENDDPDNEELAKNFQSKLAKLAMEQRNAKSASKTDITEVVNVEEKVEKKEEEEPENTKAEETEDKLIEQVNVDDDVKEPTLVPPQISSKDFEETSVDAEASVDYNEDSYQKELDENKADKEKGEEVEDANESNVTSSTNDDSQEADENEQQNDEILEQKKVEEEASNEKAEIGEKFEEVESLEVKEEVNPLKKMKLTQTSTESKASPGNFARKLSMKIQEKFGRKGRVTNVMKKIADHTESYLFRKKNNIEHMDLDIEALAQFDASNGKATYQELKDMKSSNSYGDFDKNKLESYLSDREFCEVFNITRDDFAQLSSSKKKRIKKRLGL